MPVQNRIAKVQKRNRALVRFDQDRIARAILRAAQSIGGFREEFLTGVNARLFDMCPTDEAMAAFLSDTVVLCLNSDPQHLTANFPPTIEMIQDAVVHSLRSHGFANTADAYECYRWGRHWLREGALPPEKFVGNGFPQAQIETTLAWNRARGCDTVAGLNHIVRAGRLRPLIEESLSVYERSLDDAAAKVTARVNGGDPVRLIWIAGPTCSGKTTTTIKFTDRLKRHGLRFLTLNLDDYFWPVIEHPTDWINDRNYETPEALDIQLVNQHLRALLDGQTVEKPVFSFKEGRRVGVKPVKLERDEILVLDCLHGLYPPLNEGLDPSAQFRLYIDAYHAMYEGDGATKHLTRLGDVRLLRRILRDARHRSHSPLRTLLHWHYVRSGELFSIVPLSGLADHVINGGFPFDFPVLKSFFEGPSGLWPGAADLQPYAGFLDARIRHERISALLGSVAGIPSSQLDELIPGDALVREFIGGSTIRIPHND
jgi:uridine kinase